MDDLISRQTAIDAFWQLDVEIRPSAIDAIINILMSLPSAQPEPAIPLSWIEGQIEWLKSLDNEFSTLTAGHISAMVNKWKKESEV